MKTSDNFDSSEFSTFWAVIIIIFLVSCFCSSFCFSFLGTNEQRWPFAYICWLSLCFPFNLLPFISMSLHVQKLIYFCLIFRTKNFSCLIRRFKIETIKLINTVVQMNLYNFTYPIDTSHGTLFLFIKKKKNKNSKAIRTKRNLGENSRHFCLLLFSLASACMRIIFARLPGSLIPFGIEHEQNQRENVI